MSKQLFILFFISLTTCSFALGQELGRAADPEPAKKGNQAGGKADSSTAPNLFAPETLIVALSASPTDIPRPGEGYDMIKGVRRPVNCIQFGAMNETYIGSAKSSLSQVTDDEMYWRKQSATIDAKASYGGYSGGGSYAETIETKTSTTHVNVVARSNFITKAVGLLPAPNALKVGALPQQRIDLTVTAYNLISDGKFTDFRNTCGDGYVAQVAYGAFFVTTLDFSTSDYNQKKDVSASIKASGPADLFNVNGSSKIQTEVKNRSSALRIESYQFGGDIQTNATTVEDLIAAYKQLPEVAKKNPTPLYITVVRYDALPSVKIAKSKVTPYWIYADQGLRQLMRLQTLKNDLAMAIADFTGRGGGDPADQPGNFLFFKGIETKVHSLSGYRDTFLDLEKDARTLGDWLGKCMAEATENSCKPKESDSLAEYDDLKWKAKMPIARADMDPALLADIQARSQSTDPYSKKEARCYLALAIRADVIRLTSALRQKYDNASSEELTRKAETETMKSLELGATDCGGIFPGATGFQIRELSAGARAFLASHK